MSPSLALLLWSILLVALLRFDPSSDRGISMALWVPVIWMFIVGTRLPSQWLGGQVARAAGALEEGNSMDRAVYSVLIILAIGTLMSRSFKWGVFFTSNLALTLWLVFTLVSVVWSDFPFIAFKRWFRDLGNFLMILVVLSDPHPSDAARAFLRRLSYLIIPLCLLLIKYYTPIGMQYNVWNGVPEYVGATTSKNMLGVACLVSGLFFFWDTLNRWPNRKEGRTRLILSVNAAFLAMTLYLLHLSSSATSAACLMLGCILMAAAHAKALRRHPGFLTVLIPVNISLYLVLAFGFGIDMNAAITSALGRDSTFTGRTVIWHAVLSTHTNPLLGTGYDTFWLGPRLDHVWAQTGLGINEAHDGYLETYLNLGLLGLLFLGGFLISSYRTVRKTIEGFTGLSCLPFALWTIVIFYNVTEAAFKGQLIWVIFLLGAIVVPAPHPRQVSPAQKSAFGSEKEETPRDSPAWA
jgi:exopolysaccharide production protein ExoQ